MALIVAGRIVPLDEGDPDAVFQGRVFVDDSGTIERVTSGTDSAPSGFSAAPVMDVGDAFVLPGLIDLHNHIGYNTLPLWTEPTQEIAFAHHDSWTRADSYQASISWPANGAGAGRARGALGACPTARAGRAGRPRFRGGRRPIVSTSKCCVTSTTRPSERPDHNLFYTSALTKKPLDLAKIAQAMHQRRRVHLPLCRRPGGIARDPRVRRRVERRLPRADLHRHPLQRDRGRRLAAWAATKPARWSGRRSPICGSMAPRRTSRRRVNKACPCVWDPTGALRHEERPGRDQGRQARRANTLGSD